MEAFQFDDIGNALERKPSNRSVSEKRPKKRFIQKRERLLRGAHEEEDIERNALRRGKNLAFSKVHA